MATLDLKKFDPLGVIRDRPAEEVPDDFYSQASNFHFEDSAAVRSDGWQERFGPPLAAPWAVYSAQQSGLGDQPKWLYAGPSHIGVTSLNGTFDLTPAGGVSVDAKQGWTFSQISLFPTMCNGIDAPWYWDFNEAGEAIPLPGFWVGTCGALRSYKEYLIAMNITDAGDNLSEAVRWSVSAGPGAVPTTWVPDQANDAGDVQLTATPGRVIDGRQLRNAFIIYKDTSTYVLQWVGGQFVMQLRKLFLSSGLLTDGCAVEGFGKHFCLTTDDVIAHDGVDAQSIADGSVRREIFSQIDPEFYAAAFVMHNTYRDELWICYPEGGNEFCNKAAVWTPKHNRWGFRDMPSTVQGHRGFTGLAAADGQTWDDFNIAWDVVAQQWNQVVFSEIREGLIIADPVSNKLFVMDNSLTQDGSLVHAYLAKESLGFGMVNTIKLVQSVWPRITGSVGAVVNIRVGTQLSIDEAIEWGPELPFTIGEMNKVDTFASGRYISISFETTSLTAYRVEGFEVEWRAQGHY